MVKIIANGEDFNWTDKPVLGATLRGLGGTMDSYKHEIKKDKLYRVGKHKTEGQVVILPVEKENKDEKDTKGSIAGSN